ncbi:hypothetical protein QE152_g36873 [Popillia japonica]|uniref:Uncharacterized protein n=1 Tax=Popillia japonica TaxID=7064 RepID=A0AAW1ICA1_POPJA
MNRANQKPVSRQEFMLSLKDGLIKPWLEIRKNITTSRRPIRQDICDILETELPIDPPSHAANRRTVCSFCPSRLRKMTTHHLAMLLTGVQFVVFAQAGFVK